MLPVSPQISLRAESTPCPRVPWNVAIEHECQIPVSSRSPRNTPLSILLGWWVSMDVVHPRCAGIDCSKKDAKVCVRVQGEGRRRASSTVTTWGATTSQILALREHLIAAQVTCVVIESTSDYWKPFYYLLDDELDLMLVNASRVRNVPGRKTDVSDAAWLADLGAHGLVTASLVPPPPIRALRDLTRTRTHITRERSREVTGWPCWVR
jgi:transposase